MIIGSFNSVMPNIRKLGSIRIALAKIFWYNFVKFGMLVRKFEKG